jgi:DNA-binding MarR family transcriptional regulator
MEPRLREHNRRVREWADKQPKYLRKSALAFGYPAKPETCTHDFSLEQLAKMSRDHKHRRKGEGVSRATLVRHLKVFLEAGVIERERRTVRGVKNLTSVYRINFEAVAQAKAEPQRDDQAEREDWEAAFGDPPDSLRDDPTSGCYDPGWREYAEAQKRQFEPWLTEAQTQGSFLAV